MICSKDGKSDTSDKPIKCVDTDLQERKILKEQISCLQDQLKARDRRIEELENILESNKVNIATQV